MDFKHLIHSNKVGIARFLLTHAVWILGQIRAPSTLYTQIIEKGNEEVKLTLDVHNRPLY